MSTHTVSTHTAAPRGATRTTFRGSDWPMYYLVRIERRHMLNASCLLAPHGLNHREWRLLSKAHEHGPVSVGKLAERALFERPTVSKMVNRLSRRGLLQRAESDRDRRSQLISVTRLGAAKLAETEPLVRGLLQRYAAGMRRADYEALMRLLRAFQAQVANALSAEVITRAAKRSHALTPSRRSPRRRS